MVSRSSESRFFFSIKNVVNRCHDAPISLEKMHQRLFYNRLGSLRSVLQSALITFKCYSTHETTRNGFPLFLFKMVTSRLEQAFWQLTGKRETFQLSITNRWMHNKGEPAQFWVFENRERFPMIWTLNYDLGLTFFQCISQRSIV